MGKHWYASVEWTSGRIVDVIRYDDKRQRDAECSAMNQAGIFLVREIGSKEAGRLVRELFCLHPYERLDYGEIIWIGGWSPTIGTKIERPYLRTH